MKKQLIEALDAAMLSAEVTERKIDPKTNQGPALIALAKCLTTVADVAKQMLQMGPTEWSEYVDRKVVTEADSEADPASIPVYPSRKRL